MYNAWYTNNETHVGPLSRANELCLDISAFLRYTQHVKSTVNTTPTPPLPLPVSSSLLPPPSTHVSTSSAATTSQLSSSSLDPLTQHEDRRQQQPSAVPQQQWQFLQSPSITTTPPTTKHLLNEFLVDNTRMRYFDGKQHLGFAATPYASALTLQNFERLIIQPDVGYYLEQYHQSNSQDPTSKRNNNSNQRQSYNKSDKSHVNGKERLISVSNTNMMTDRRRSRRKMYLNGEGNGSNSGACNNILVSGQNDKIKWQLDHDQRFLHSDFTRKYSPQEALARVLASPLFNGNNTKTILQSNKSERYYQLTFPLENCSRMYVLAAPMLPCYAVLQPWAHVCRLFQINPLNPPSRYAVPIEQCSQWSYMKDQYNAKYVILLPPNLSMMNRRDPVIQEGSLELITVIFAYDTCDADIQFNNPYGCYNKNEDYDGDTNTQSIGKGVESHVDICFNMKRQCLPCLRVKSVIPQNMLSRIMMYFLFNDNNRNDPHLTTLQFHILSARNQEKLRDLLLECLLSSSSSTKIIREQAEVSADTLTQKSNIAEQVTQLLFDNANVYAYMIDHQFDETQHDDDIYEHFRIRSGQTENTTTKKANTREQCVKRIFGLELFRRTCFCLLNIVTTTDQRIVHTTTLLERATALFGTETYASLYLQYLTTRWNKIKCHIGRFVYETIWPLTSTAIKITSTSTNIQTATSTTTSTLLTVSNSSTRSLLPPPPPPSPPRPSIPLTPDDNQVYIATQEILHEIHTLWAPISLSAVTNCQTLLDDVIRTIYCLTDENECTRVLDRLSYTVHTKLPYFFLGKHPFDIEYIANVLSRAKGDFDSLLRMQASLYFRFRREAEERTLEQSRSKPLLLGNRDLLTRVSNEQLQKYIDYTDKYVLGSKRIPKSCKQANSMKWAMQNVQYFDGDLWMNGELLLSDVTKYFSLEFFADTTAIKMVLNSMATRFRETQIVSHTQQ